MRNKKVFLDLLFESVCLLLCHVNSGNTSVRGGCCQSLLEYIKRSLVFKNNIFVMAEYLADFDKSEFDSITNRPHQSKG